MSQNMINELTDRVSALSARVLDLEHECDRLLRESKGWEVEAVRLGNLARNEYARAEKLLAERNAAQGLLESAILIAINDRRRNHRDYGNKAVGLDLNLPVLAVKETRERLRDKGFDV